MIRVVKAKRASAKIAKNSAKNGGLWSNMVVTLRCRGRSKGMSGLWSDHPPAKIAHPEAPTICAMATCQPWLWTSHARKALRVSRGAGSHVPLLHLVCRIQLGLNHEALGVALRFMKSRGDPKAIHGDLHVFPVRKSYVAANTNTHMQQ